MRFTVAADLLTAGTDTLTIAATRSVPTRNRWMPAFDSPCCSSGIPAPDASASGHSTRWLPHESTEFISEDAGSTTPLRCVSDATRTDPRGTPASRAMSQRIAAPMVGVMYVSLSATATLSIASGPAVTAACAGIPRGDGDGEADVSPLRTAPTPSAIATAISRSTEAVPTAAATSRARRGLWQQPPSKLAAA